MNTYPSSGICPKTTNLLDIPNNDKEVFLDSNMIDVLGHNMTVREFFIRLCGANALYNENSRYLRELGYFVQNICIGDDHMKHSIHIHKYADTPSYNNIIDECLADYWSKYMLICAREKMYCIDVKQNNLFHILEHPENFINTASSMNGVIIFNSFEKLKTFDNTTYYPSKNDKNFNIFLELFICQKLPYQPADYYDLNKKFGPFDSIDPWKYANI